MKYLKKLWPVFLLFIFTIIFFFKGIFINKYQLFVSDIQLDFVTQYFSASTLKAGTLPLWDPYYYGPFLAYYNSAIFYPFNMIMQRLFSIHNLNFDFLIYEYNIMLHIFMAAVFMYLLMRQLKVSKFSALLSAALYGFGGFMVGQIVHLQIMNANVWAPLLFLLVIKALDSSLIYALFAGLVLGVMYLAGHPQPTVYYILFIFAFCLYKFTTLIKDGQDFKIYLRPLYAFTIFVALGLAVAAIELLPFFEFIPYSLRAQTNYKEMSHLGSVSAGHLISLFNPDFFSGKGLPYWGTKFTSTGLVETNYYLGGIPVLLLGLLLVPSARAHKGFLFFAMLASLFLMLGNNTILFGWMYLLPVFNKMRLACRIGSVFNFLLAILAGYGFENMLHHNNFLEKKQGKIRTILLSIIFIFMAWIAIFAFRLSAFKENTEAYLKMAGVCKSIIYSFSLLIFAAVSFWFYLRFKKKIFTFAIFALSIFSLFLYQGNFYPASARSPENIFPQDFLKPQGLKFLKADPAIYRSRITEFADVSRLAQVNNIYTLGYPGAVGLARLIKFRSLFEESGPPYMINNPVSSLMDFYNVKYLYSSIDLSRFSPKYEAIPAKPGWFINKDVFIRAFCVNEYIIIKDEDNILKALDKTDLKKYVILEEKPSFFPDVGVRQGEASCDIIRYSNNEVDINVNALGSTFVVLSDIWYPGWQAFVDNRPVKIYRANYAFRAVRVPAGEHNLKFVYRPQSFRLGALITGISIIFVSIFVIFRLFKR